LRNKEKFRSDIVNGNLDMSNLTSAKLKQRGFSPIPKKGKSAEPQVEGAIDYSSKEQETVSPSVSIEEATLDDYKYLLIVNLFDFTLENLEKLKAERAEKENEYKTLVETSPKSMWLHDLNLFEKELDVRDNY
jgi:DNA topoisomerase II